MADYHYYKGTYYFKDYDNIWSETQPFIVVDWKRRITLYHNDGLSEDKNEARKRKKIQ